ncbi:hypothetical protein Tco_0053032 [Tanacetum coccineum]
MLDSFTENESEDIEHTTSLIAKNDEFKAQLQEKGFAIAALKNELRKLTGNSVNTKISLTNVKETRLLMSVQVTLLSTRMNAQPLPAIGFLVTETCPHLSSRRYTRDLWTSHSEIVVLKGSQAVIKSLRNLIVIFARTFRVILFSIHNDEWKSFQCHHQTALRSNGGNGNLHPIQLLNLRDSSESSRLKDKDFANSDLKLSDKCKSIEQWSKTKDRKMERR